MAKIIRKTKEMTPKPARLLPLEEVGHGGGGSWEVLPLEYYTALVLDLVAVHMFAHCLLCVMYVLQLEKRKGKWKHLWIICS